MGFVCLKKKKNTIKFLFFQKNEKNDDRYIIKTVVSRDDTTH